MPHRLVFFKSSHTFLSFLVVPALGASSLARTKEPEERSIRGFIKTSTALLHRTVRSTTCLPHLGWTGTSLAFVTSVSCSSKKKKSLLRPQSQIAFWKYSAIPVCTGCRSYRNIVFLSSQSRIKISQSATKCLSYIIYI